MTAAARLPEGSPASPTWLIAPVLLVIGAALVIAALLSGSGRLYLLLFVPLIAGSSPLFILGVVLLFLGFMFLPTAFVRTPRWEEVGHIDPTPDSSSPSGNFTSGGLILVGPVPIFWGAWKHAPRWAYVISAIAGALAVAFLLLYFLGRL
ncbi:MAG: DUF131 domain-containing protein [Thermoplasmata archaeon]